VCLRAWNAISPCVIFIGKLNKLTLTIDRPKLSPEDVKQFEAMMRKDPASD
jgi:hypothetical protein